MFERFTKDARAVVEGAFAHAQDGGARSVDAEHLLLALTVVPGVAGEVLADHGVTFEGVSRVCPAARLAGG
ncbi:hypothetical protein AQJ11_23355 [Streptomyces corchorusii]|uniref:Clp R domain-containing protein n=2 Tax=Streptomyces TaxID=1883 RepID=A0A101Q630_STRCK|nr:Clp protease N-terminal domain-containing protein [Streptomyces corchorusii]KUN23843.1 hypothetical protein AQJ11_23355 [Streptomyces corchorusii]